MIVTYLRSSSIGSHALCPFQHYLTYVLGVPSGSGKAAAKGSVMHKALETLAWQGYYSARGVKEYDDETFGPLKVKDITPEWASRAAYAHYKEVEPDVKWNDRYDLADCVEWTNKAVTQWGGLFDPRKLDVIEPEKRFDVTIDEPWARYEYDAPEGRVEGQLSLKGTVDLIVRDAHDPSLLEIIDWKSGQRKDWGEPDEAKAEKTWEKLGRDNQLLLYLYAISKVYPEFDAVMLTIVYVNSGGPFRPDFGPNPLQAAEDMIRSKFEEIKNTTRPRLKVGKPCFTFCPFGRRSVSEHDPSKTVCQFFNDQVNKKGADAVMAEFGVPNAYNSYGSGGGRQTSGQ